MCLACKKTYFILREYKKLFALGKLVWLPLMRVARFYFQGISLNRVTWFCYHRKSLGDILGLRLVTTKP